MNDVTFASFIKQKMNKIKKIMPWTKMQVIYNKVLYLRPMWGLLKKFFFALHLKPYIYMFFINLNVYFFIHIVYPLHTYDGRVISVNVAFYLVSHSWQPSFIWSTGSTWYNHTDRHVPKVSYLNIVIYLENVQSTNIL